MVERNLHESYAVTDMHLYCTMHRMSLEGILYMRMHKDPCFSHLGQQSLNKQGLLATRKIFSTMSASRSKRNVKVPSRLKHYIASATTTTDDVIVCLYLVLVSLVACAGYFTIDR